MKKKANAGIADSFEITGTLGKSEEPSPRFVITGQGRGFTCSGGAVQETKKSELYLREDLQDAHNFLAEVPLGTKVKWTECLGLKKGGSLVYRYSIEVLPERRRAAKRSR